MCKCISTPRLTTSRSPDTHTFALPPSDNAANWLSKPLLGLASKAIGLTTPPMDSLSVLRRIPVEDMMSWLGRGRDRAGVNGTGWEVGEGLAGASVFEFNVRFWRFRASDPDVGAAQELAAVLREEAARLLDAV